MKIDVFISYSSKNPDAAKAICHVLESNGIKCWIAPRDIPAGKMYGDLISEAITSCKLFLLVYSNNSLKSQWCNGELNVAFGKGKTIIPYRIDSTPLKGAMEVILSQTHWIDSYPDYTTRFDELVKTICDILGKTPRRVEPEPVQKPVVSKEVVGKDGEKTEAKEAIIIGLCLMTGAIGFFIALVIYLINRHNMSKGLKPIVNPVTIKYILCIYLVLILIGLVAILLGEMCSI